MAVRFVSSVNIKMCEYGTQRCATFVLTRIKAPQAKIIIDINKMVEIKRSTYHRPLLLPPELLREFRNIQQQDEHRSSLLKIPPHLIEIPLIIPMNFSQSLCTLTPIYTGHKLCSSFV